VAELTAHFGLNHNAIRQHLAKLVEAGLVVETTAAARGPGRPRLLYQVDPVAESRWGVTGPYERLSVLLSRSSVVVTAPSRSAGAPGVTNTSPPGETMMCPRRRGRSSSHGSLARLVIRTIRVQRQ
jgi:DNA-binding transcriptional ArsR family regulator